MHERNSLEPHSQTQNREKSYFFWFVGMFRSSGKDPLNPDCYSRWKLGPFWTGNKSAIHGLTPPSISLVEKIKIFFVSGKIHDHGLLALWKSNMDALPVGKTKPDAERTLEVCWWVGITRVQQKSDLSLTLQACTQIWILRKPSQNLDLQCYSHPPYNPGLAPSDFHQFGDLKDVVHSTKFETDDDVIRAVRTWLCKQDKAWYQQGIHTLVPHWCKAIEVDRDLMEK